jgi:hypothetical protein
MTRDAHGSSRTRRALKRLTSQETALDNAAEASAGLRERRHEREEVDAYLKTLPPPVDADTP